MKYLKIVCYSAEIVLATDSEMIYNYFLIDEEQVPETIPGIKRIPIDNYALKRNYIIYSSNETRIVQIEPELNCAIICVPEKELYLPDLIYLIMTMLSKELNKEDKYFIHCAVVEKDNKATLIVGDPGSGKTTLALYMCMEKGYNFVCNDRAVIGIYNEKPYIYCGTLQTHIRIGTIHEYFPQLVSQINEEKLDRPWENKIYINPEFENLGVNIKHTAFIENILFTSTYPVQESETQLILQERDTATLSIMKYLSEYIRADRNIILSTGFPFPSFDSQDLAIKRIKMVNKLVDTTAIFNARGNIKILATMIDKNLYKSNCIIKEKSNYMNFLGKEVKVVMDRPVGTKHPIWGFVYLLNYGYIPNTMSGDGEEIDAYIVGEYNPIKEYEGICIAIIHRLDDDDDKLIVAPPNRKYSKEQIEILIEFQERFFNHIILDEYDL